MTPPPWLPDLVRLSDHGGDWDRYLGATYEIYRQDFEVSRPTFEGRPLAAKRHPISRGKEATFWHIVSSGPIEEERLPDLRRFERIRWPRAIIDHASEPAVLVWETLRRRDRRVCLWLESTDYLVVLARRSGYDLLWTAYPVDRDHTRRKLRKDYERAQKR
jgi:hypothetical protein